MARYKYRICKEDGKYRFELLPNNSNDKCVAKSSLYDTFDDAIKGIEAFKMYMSQKGNEKLNTEFIHYQDNNYILYIYFGASHDVFVRYRICPRYNLTKAEQRIRENYLAPIRRDL